MKEQIENLLRGEKERIIASEKEKRNNHLISIRLIDEGKSSRIYHAENGDKWDKEKGKWYTENLVALDVTDEEYTEICKYFPPSKIDGKSSKIGDGGNDDVKTIKNWVTFMGVTLLVFIMMNIVIFIKIVSSTRNFW
jgi:hypothetical protein